MTTSTVMLKPSAPALPPTVGGMPLIGALPRLIKGKFDFLEAARQKEGDIYRLDLGFADAIVLCHPRHAQHVLLDNMKNYAKGGAMWDSVRTMLGNGLPVSEGAFWRRQRRMIQPAFHHQRLMAIADQMVAAIDESLERWEPYAQSGEPIDVAQAFTHMTMNVLVRTMFGSELKAGEAEAVGAELTYAIDFMLRAMMTNSLPAWMPVPGRARYQQAIRVIDEVVFNVIERGRQEKGAGDNMLSMLLEMVDEESGERMTDAELRDEAVSLFLAGYETTSVAMSWALHFMTQQPEIRQRLQQEVDTVLGERKPTMMDLRQITYARNIMQESMRLYPPAYWIPRTAVEDDVIDGYHIPAGKMVAVMSQVIQRHPEQWEDPHVFDPDRFLPARSEGRHKLAWLPFGAGQRLCIGREFALMEGPFILARLMQRYEPVAVPEKVAQMHIGLTIRTKDGVWVKLNKRGE
ncbi:MAG: cytochrome P450 [Caldilineaceae bacterium]|nr:cytochrome P450 [Caldilineaceae bacterium]